jgi:hypothetical protein
MKRPRRNHSSSSDCGGASSTRIFIAGLRERARPAGRADSVFRFLQSTEDSSVPRLSNIGRNLLHHQCQQADGHRGLNNRHERRRRLRSEFGGCQGSGSLEISGSLSKSRRISPETREPPATAWRLQTCQPGPPSSRSAKNAPTALSAWSAAPSVPTPATKPCGMPCQTSLLAFTPASTARAT